MQGVRTGCRDGVGAGVIQSLRSVLNGDPIGGLRGLLCGSAAATLARSFFGGRGLGGGGVTVGSRFTFIGCRCVRVAIGLAVLGFGRRLGTRWRRWRQLRNDFGDFLLGHVVVHVLPARKNGGTGGGGVEREAILDRPSGMTAGASDRLAIRFGLDCGFGRVGDAELLAASEQRGDDGKAKGDAKRMSGHG